MYSSPNYNTALLQYSYSQNGLSSSDIWTLNRQINKQES